MPKNSYLIVLDFDGTVVRHRFPKVGEDIGAAPILQRLVAHGHRLLLNTMRSRITSYGDTLQPALDWFSERGIPLYGVNENPEQKSWTASPKVYGDIYIDDAALGAPLTVDPVDGDLYLDWNEVAVCFYQAGLLSTEDVAEMVDNGEVDIKIVEKRQ